MPAVVMYMRSALPCSTTLVSPPTMRTPASRAAFAIARTSASSTSRGQAGFEHVGDHQRFGAGAGNRQVVHRAVDRQFADGAAGKAQRLDHELSVVMAMRVPLMSTCAASPSGSVESIRTAAARTGLRSAAGSPCHRRRAPFRSADRGTGSCGSGRRPSDCVALGREHAGHHRRLCDVRSCSRRRMILPTKPSARRRDARACTPCRTTCTAPASTHPSALRRTAPPWDR